MLGCLQMDPEPLALPSKPLSSKTRPQYKTAFAEAKELQKLLMADARNPDVSAAVRGSLARSWCELEETKRKLKMRPLPRSIDTTKLAKRSRAKADNAGFAEA